MKNKYEVTIKDLDTGAIVKHVKTDCFMGTMYEIKDAGNGYSAICLGNAPAARMHTCLKALEALKKSIYEKVPELHLMEQAAKALGLDKDLGEPEEEAFAQNDGVEGLLRTIAKMQGK